MRCVIHCQFLVYVEYTSSFFRLRLGSLDPSSRQAWISWELSARHNVVFSHCTNWLTPLQKLSKTFFGKSWDFVPTGFTFDEIYWWYIKSVFTLINGTLSWGRWAQKTFHNFLPSLLPFRVHFVMQQNKTEDNLVFAFINLFILPNKFQFKMKK